MVESVSAGSGPVGIDDLNVDGSTLSVDSAVIASERGLTDRDLQMVGFDRRSLLPPYEDAVTLAVNAGRPIVESAGRDSFELLIVATESGLDWGKPISAYVHQYLGLPARCRNFEVKHACYGGTAAVQMAVAWVRAGSAPGKKALVVMTDVARRHLGDPAELTAGTGAVAVAIAAEPRILQVEPASGFSCREIYDVARPTATGEWADTVLSVAAYLDLIEEAWENYQRATGMRFALDERFRYLVCHTPLIALVRDAHRLLLETDRGHLPVSEIRESFRSMVEPGLRYGRELANIYSGSAYCLLAGLIDGTAELDPSTRIGICSYGSGSCAEIYGGVVAETARATVRRNRIDEHLAARIPVNVDQYERLVKETEAILVAKDYEPARDFVPGHFTRRYAERERLVLMRIENYHRRYGWSTSISDPQ
jgi:3-hydroxy-3-methylglutaryl CoA synthase